MAINIEWIINKAQEKIYVVTHAKAAARGDSTVDDDLTTIEANISDLQTQIGNINNEEFNNHIAQSLFSEEGVHGFRLIQNSYNQDELQYKNENGEWATITVAASGLAPAGMKTVGAVLGNNSGEVILSGTDPDDTEVNETVISRWAGTKIVRKAGSVPTSPDDGVLVANYQVRNQHSTADTGVVDSGLTGNTTYYYRWFTYADNGAVNITGNSSASIYVPSASILGVIADWENNTYTRTDDAVGLTAGANFDQFKMFGQRRRCIVADDGTILAFYGDEAYTETGKLTQAVTKNETTYPVGTSCQVMVYQPKFYYKVTPLTLEDNPNGGQIMRKAKYQISQEQYHGFKNHPCFGRNGVDTNYVLFAAYEAGTQKSDNTYVSDSTSATIGTKLASVAGVYPFYASNQTINTDYVTFARNLANARGTGWQTADILSVSCTQLLFMIENASMNSQECIGGGVQYYSSASVGVTYTFPVETGKTTSLGNASGKVVIGRVVNMENYFAHDVEAVTYRGEENLWGNVGCKVDGITVRNSEVSQPVNTVYGTVYWADRDFETNKFTSPYNASGIYFSRTRGYVSSFGYSAGCDWMFIPTTVDGDSSLPVGDNFYPRTDFTNPTAATWGPSATNDPDKTGLFTWNFTYYADTDLGHDGSRLIYVPSGSAVEE